MMANSGKSRVAMGRGRFRAVFGAAGLLVLCGVLTVALSVGSTPQPTASLAETGLAAVVIAASVDPGAQPVIIPREVWGAREPRCQWPGRESTRITHAVVHHTYEPTDPPSLESAYAALQHIQNLHMDDNGWCDIGYSYLVDWFGNVYEGTVGTIGHPVTSAHTAGLNFEGIGIAMIGNYQEEVPSAETVAAVGRIAGWALGWYGVAATQDVRLTVAGANNKWGPGTNITVPAITAHRDVVSTECPGDAGYLEMGAIRDVAAVVSAAMHDDGSFGSGSGTGAAIFVAGEPMSPVGSDGDIVAGAEEVVADLPHAVDEGVISEGVTGPGEVETVLDGGELLDETPAEAATLHLWWWAAVIAAVFIGFWVWWVRWRRPRADNWQEPPIAEPTAVVVPPVEPGAAPVETPESPIDRA